MPILLGPVSIYKQYFTCCNWHKHYLIFYIRNSYTSTHVSARGYDSSEETVIGQHNGPVGYVWLSGCARAGNAESVFPPPRVSDPNIHHGTRVTHVPWCMPGSLSSSFSWSRWVGKRSRHSRRMHIPQSYVSGKRPIFSCSEWTIMILGAAAARIRGTARNVFTWIVYALLCCSHIIISCRLLWYI